MLFIYSKLPIDIIKHIICFDKHFIIRNNELISRIPKDDYRYNMLKYIIIKKKTNDNFINNTYKCIYNFPNLCDIIERKEQHIDNDMIEMRIDIQEDNSLMYEIFIGRLKPINDIQTKKSIYYKGNLDNYEWEYVLYSYIKK